MPPSVDDVYWYQAIGDVVVPPSSNLQGRVGRTTICKMEILSHVLRARASHLLHKSAPRRKWTDDLCVGKSAAALRGLELEE